MALSYEDVSNFFSTPLPSIFPFLSFYPSTSLALAQHGMVLNLRLAEVSSWFSPAIDSYWDLPFPPVTFSDSPSVFLFQTQWYYYPPLLC